MADVFTRWYMEITMLLVYDFSRLVNVLVLLKQIRMNKIGKIGLLKYYKQKMVANEFTGIFIRSCCYVKLLSILLFKMLLLNGYRRKDRCKFWFTFDFTCSRGFVSKVNLIFISNWIIQIKHYVHSIKHNCRVKMLISIHVTRKVHR